MSLVALVTLALLAFLSLLVLILPFVQKASASTVAQDELQAAYERILKSIRDLDEDFQLGKIAADTHQQEREMWVEQGIAMLKHLHKDESESEGALLLNQNQSADDAIEKAIAAYRQARVKA